MAGDSAAALAAGLADGDVALLENVRFEPAETSKDDAERGPSWRTGSPPSPSCTSGDGFGALHRKHASVYDVPRGCRTSAAGDLVLAEVAVLRAAHRRRRSGPTWSCSAAPSPRTSSA